MSSAQTRTHAARTLRHEIDPQFQEGDLPVCFEEFRPEMPIDDGVDDILLQLARTVAASLDLDMKILMILTSHENLENTGLKTGFWLEELAAPYYVFKDAGAAVTLASPFGRQPPIDPKSAEAASQTDATRRFEADPVARAALARTLKLRDAVPGRFDAVFYPGGHGPLWDLAENAYSIALIEAMLAAGKPVAAVCQAAGVLRHVKSSDGKPVVFGRAVTGFANTEENAVGMTRIAPFLVEDMLTRSGGHYTKAGDWQPHVVTDGLLITGQNPASSETTAKALLHAIRVAFHQSDQTVPGHDD